MDGIFGLLLTFFMLWAMFNLPQWIAKRAANKTDIFNKEGKLMPKTTLSSRAIATLVGVGVLILILLQGVVIIGAGERGVIFNSFNGVSPRVLSEGMHLVIPFVEQITKYNVRVQSYTMTRSRGEGAEAYKESDDSLWAPTKDGLKVGVDLTVRFHPNPEKVYLLHQTIGPDYEEKVVRAQVRSVARMTISGYDIQEVYSSKGRTEIQQRIQSQIADMFAKNDLICDEMLLRDVFFTPEYEKAVENKQSAEQRRQQTEIDAASARIEAQGRADALNIVNNVIAKNPKLLAYKWIEKLGDQVKVLIVPQGTGTFLDPSKY